MTDSENTSIVTIMEIATGYRHPRWVDWSEARVYAVLGDSVAEQEVATCREWFDEFVAETDMSGRESVRAAAASRRERFAEGHPQLPSGVLDVLEWAYYLSYK